MYKEFIKSPNNSFQLRFNRMISNLFYLYIVKLYYDSRFLFLGALLYLEILLIKINTSTFD